MPRKAIDTPNRIYSKNYININCTFEADSAPNTITRICDFKPYENSWVADNPSAYIKIYLADLPEDYQNKRIDTFVLQNHNLASYSLGYIDGSNAEYEVYSKVGGTSKDDIIKLAVPFTGSLIYLKVTATQDNENVSIGQFRALKHIIDLVATTQTDIAPEVDEQSYRTADGSLIAWRNFQKWGASISAENLSKELHNTFIGFIKKDVFVTLMPWEDFEPRDIYECRVPYQSAGSYDINRWSGRLNIKFKFEAKENALY